MATVLAEVRRGTLVECRHYGAVAVTAADGTLIASAGDPGLRTFFRSSAKPFQALPIVTSGAADAYEFTDAELAVCAASHNGEPIHLEVVAGLLSRLGLGDSHLQCGVVPPIDRTEAARSVLDAMAAEPYMVAGRGRICTDLMTLTGPSIVVKTGAEAVFCLALRERGWGVAIKVEDGNSRAMPVIVASIPSSWASGTTLRSHNSSRASRPRYATTRVRSSANCAPRLR